MPLQCLLNTMVTDSPPSPYSESEKTSPSATASGSHEPATSQDEPEATVQRTAKRPSENVLKGKMIRSV